VGFHFTTQSLNQKDWRVGIPPKNVLADKVPFPRNVRKAEQGSNFYCVNLGGLALRKPGRTVILETCPLWDCWFSSWNLSFVQLPERKQNFWNWICSQYQMKGWISSYSPGSVIYNLHHWTTDWDKISLMDATLEQRLRLPFSNGSNSGQITEIRFI
jgi:hypothetical protein